MAKSVKTWRFPGREWWPGLTKLDVLASVGRLSQGIVWNKRLSDSVNVFDARTRLSVEAGGGVACLFCGSVYVITEKRGIPAQCRCGMSYAVLDPAHTSSENRWMMEAGLASHDLIPGWVRDRGVGCEKEETKGAAGTASTERTPAGQRGEGPTRMKMVAGVWCCVK